ncbi:MAG: nucleotide exchange factor GrpE [Pseudonocardiaceae bacterium]
MDSEHRNKMDGVGESETWNVAAATEETSVKLDSLSSQSGGDQEVPSPENDTPLRATEDEDTGTRPGIEPALRTLTDAVQALRDDFQRSQEVYNHQRVLLDKLHDENEQLRRAELERARDPMVRDLISLVDTCLRNGRAWLERDTVTPGNVDDVLRDVANDVKLILERQGVETFTPEAGTKFDRREARAERSVNTSDASLDGAVAEVLKPGYRAGNRVLRYCDVVVWAFKA